MNNNSKVSYFVLIVIILIIGYFSYANYRTRNVPREVINSEVYGAGSTISLYDGVPADFPKEVVLEGKPLKYSGVVASPQNSSKINVSYISSRTVNDALAFYKVELEKLGWNLRDRSTSFTTALLLANKEGKNVTITFAPAQNNETLITFQYEQ